jgi:hypothetical protein
MTFLIVFAVIILCGIGLTVFMVIRSFDEMASGLVGTLCALAIIAWVVVFAFYNGAQSIANYWNKLHDTKYTAEDWFWNGSMIESYDLKLKTTKSDIDLHINQ